MWSLDTIISVGVVLIIGWFSLSDLLKPFFRRAKTDETVKRSRQIAGAAMRSGRSKVKNVLNARSARQNARSAVQPVRPVQAKKAEILAPVGDDVCLPRTTDELTRLAKAVELHAKGATQQAAIEEAFSCSKGGGEGWRRAKALFDAATKGGGGG